MDNVLKKIFFLFFPLTVTFVLCLPLISMAGETGARDDIVARELDCVSGHLNDTGKLSWQDICYSQEDAEAERLQVIDRALTQAAWELEEWQEEKEPIASGRRRLEVVLDEQGNLVTQEMDEEDLEIAVTGEIKMGLGITPQETLWKKANWDLNERNFRMISADQLNNKENSFDPAIYEQLKFDIDAQKSGLPFSFHSNISIDPWSFTAKSDKFTVIGSGGDRVEVEALYWANTGYTVNQNFNTLDNGDMVSFPELKKTGSRTLPTTVTSKLSNTFTFPEIKLEKQFQPFRELWMDYAPDENLRLRVFPMAYQDMALTSDDPLHLSNNHIYWEESSWLVDWKPGNFNSGATPVVDFTKGKWDDSLAFFTRDSEGIRLTALRGVSLEMQPSDQISFKGVIASPKGLWQEYDSIRSIPASFRLKNFLSDSIYLGGVTNLHYGFNGGKLDAYNYVGGVDGGIALSEGIKIEAEAGTSRQKQDMTNDTYETKKRGNTYYLALTATSSPEEDILNKDYFGLHPYDEGAAFLKGQLYYAHMDDGFESSLASYRETRNDMFWSRHVHFRSQADSSVKPFAIGNGIDIGRYVMGLRFNASTESGRLKNETHIRNVHQAGHKFIENVARTEFEYQATDRLNTRLFLLRHDLPKTKGGMDPFIFDASTGEFFTNAAIPDGEDPSMWTVSSGAQYDLTEKIKIHGIWEYTNDFTAATGDFPRALLNESSFTTFTENGQTFRRELRFLNRPGAFDLPPYEHHNIFKAGLEFRPIEKLEMYLDYARNPNEYAGKIDNNMNHVGLELNYKPTSRLGMSFKYTFSRSNDIFHLNNSGETVYETHHNVFAEINYKTSETDRFILQYGVGMSPTVASMTFDPHGGSLATLDTQHIFRLRYQKSF